MTGLDNAGAGTAAGKNENAAPPERPLWRKVWEFPLVAMVIAICLVVAALIASSELLFLVLSDDWPEVLRTVLPPLTAVTAVFLVMKFAVSRLGRAPRDDVPLAIAPAHIAAGLGIGFVIFAIVVGIAAAIGVYRITGWGTMEGWLGTLMAAGVVAGFVEEVLFRGIVFRWLEELGGSWAALAISSLLFGFLHAANPNATVFSSIAIAVEAGILLGAAYMLTRSLWLAVGIHAGWNVTQGLIFDVPVSGMSVDGIVEAELSGPDLLSGGAFGLEASVIGLVVATGAGLCILLLARQRGEVIGPIWSKRPALDDRSRS